MTKRFDGKVALITGGGSGIGRAAALQFASEGAQVVLGNRNEQAGQETVKLITDAGGTACFLRTDVTQTSDVEALVHFAVSQYGGLDAACNNAGTEGGTATILDDTEENYKLIHDVNVLGVWRSMKFEIEYMLKHGGGSIVNISSIAGLIGFPQHGAYVASKHAVLGMTKTAALEFGAYGIRVNAVSPAAIETDMLERFMGETEEERTQSREYMKGLHPIGRLGQASEIAGAILWLCSDDASFMLGQSVTVDGGFTAI